MNFSAKLDELQQRAAAIDHAAWRVDNARLAVLDAIDTRACADELATTAGS